MVDHSFTEKPYRLYIEPKPGGGFYELFNEAGEGARHATVIYAERGKRLRFEGPLGLSGPAVQVVTTYDFAPEMGVTKLRLPRTAAGQVTEALAAQVAGVWHHFLVERLKPCIESGEYLRRKP